MCHRSSCRRDTLDQLLIWFDLFAFDIMHIQIAIRACSLVCDCPHLPQYTPNGTPQYRSQCWRSKLQTEIQTANWDPNRKLRSKLQTSQHCQCSQYSTRHKIYANTLQVTILHWRINSHTRYWDFPACYCALIGCYQSRVTGIGHC